MSDFLSSLATRALNAAPVIQPRPLTVFEPWPTDGALGARRPPDLTPDDASTVETTMGSTRPTRDAAPAETNPATPIMAAPMPEETTNAASSPTRSDFAARSAAPRESASPPTLAPVIERAASSTIAAPHPEPSIIDHHIEPRRRAEPTPPVERLIVEHEQIDREPEKPPVPVLAPQTILIEKPAAPVTSPSIVQPVVERVVDRHADTASPDRSRDVRSTSSPTTANEAPPEPSAPPVIHVTIGRVEVRATTPPAPTRRAPRSTATLSLEEYLRSREGGRR